MSEKKIGGVVEVGAGQVSRWMAEGTALVIDVRETTEYAPAHIPGAVLNPTSRFDVSAVPDPGNRSLVFSCAAGVRSQRAAERYVKEHPEATVYNLTGGFNAWSAGGHESVVNQVASDDLQGLAYTSIGLFFLVTFIVTWRLGTVGLMIGIIASALLALIGWKQPALMAMLLSKLPSAGR